MTIESKQFPLPVSDKAIYDLWCRLPSVGSVDEDVMVFARELLKAATPKEPA